MTNAPNRRLPSQTPQAIRAWRVRQAAQAGVKRIVQKARYPKEARLALQYWILAPEELYQQSRLEGWVALVGGLDSEPETLRAIMDEEPWVPFPSSEQLTVGEFIPRNKIEAFLARIVYHQGFL